MTSRATGRIETISAGGEIVAAFVPYPLPPTDPALELGDQLSRRLELAEQAIARLELAGEMVPSLDWFRYGFVRKEAVLSSQIEGTQATLLDLLTYEARDASAPEGADADVEEVCNYLDALAFARAQLQDPQGPPPSMRLLNEAHARLLRGVRGASSQPGEVRRNQNWIGGSRPGNAVYVPPPPNTLPDLLSDLERYLHADDPMHPLVRTGLVHVQFETIHPYLDGNGRIGRLLITLLLEHWGLLRRPLLYLSLFLKQHRREYYRRLTAVREEGDWEGWLDFFLDGVATIADEGVRTARDLFELVTTDRQRVLAQPGATLMAAQLFERLPGRPLVTAAWVVQTFETTKPTAGRAIEVLTAAGVLVEITGKKRDRTYAYQAYLDRLREGTSLGD